MVGVAGRSKGCNTCRRRKKGCDLERPVCRRCVKAGLECSGYDRERVFVHFPAPPAKDTPAGTSAAGTEAAARAIVAARATPAPGSDVTLHCSLKKTACEDQFMAVFWDLYMPDRKQFVGTLAKYSYRSCWVPLMRRLYNTDPALQKIMIALCLGSLARGENLVWMRQESVRLYGSALQDMNTGIQSPSRRKSDALLLASKMFGLYDLVYGFDDGDAAKISPATSWQGHSLGQVSLVMQRTPEMYQDGAPHELFIESRMSTAAMSISHRKRNALSEGPWRTIPWLNIPKTSKDHLFDILGDVAGLVEDFDNARATVDPQEKEERLQRVVDDAWGMDGSLTWWKDNFGPGEHAEELLERGIDDPSPKDIAVVYIMSHFWSAAIHVYTTLRLALQGLSLLPFSTPPPPLPDRADPRIYAKHIIDTADIFLHPLAGAFGVHAHLPPLATACSYLVATEVAEEGEDGQNWAEESPEMTKVFEHLRKDVSGTRLRGFIKSMLRDPRLAAADDGSGIDLELMRAAARTSFGMERMEGLETIIRRHMF